MASRLYCPDCRKFGDPQAEYCTTCGTKLIPCMRVVIMPFVESGQEPTSLGEFKEIVERNGGLQESLAIGCQLYISSDMENPHLIATKKEEYLSEAEKSLPQMVKEELDPLDFYEIPDPVEVDRITSEAANVPTELFVRIQDRYDPEYLFLPEINCFFFRFPRPHSSGTGMDSGFAFTQISAFLLDNRENRIVSRGNGSGIFMYDAGDATLDENFSVPPDTQWDSMHRASAEAVNRLLKAMKMTK